MELRFLGKSHSINNHSTETNALDDSTGHFLGQTYTRSRPVTTFKPQIGLRKYRGVSYIELRFVGRS